MVSLWRSRSRARIARCMRPRRRAATAPAWAPEAADRMVDLHRGAVARWSIDRSRADLHRAAAPLRPGPLGTDHGAPIRSSIFAPHWAPRDAASGTEQPVARP